MTEYFIGIDSGTQSTKALLVDDQGRVCGFGQQEYGLIEGLGAGHKEQAPQTWIAAVTAAVRQAIQQAGIDTSCIKAIGVSGQQHGLVALDQDGRVIRPAKLWCDTATAPQAETIVDKLGGLDAMVRLTGNGLPAGFTASKILYLKEHEPENYKRLKTVLLPHDYINYWLTGEMRMEWGDASGTGLMDVRKKVFNQAVVNAIGPELMDCLPPLKPSGEACGQLRQTVAEELGLRPGILVSAGGGDNMMGAIGTGNVREGIVTASLGTSGTIYAFSTKPVIDPTGAIAAFCDSTGNWLPLLCIMNATVATELVKNLFSLGTDDLNRLAAEAPAGADGLMLIPYIEGERVPDAPDGSGVWFGQRAHNATAAHFARAAMEGVALGLGCGLTRMVNSGITPQEIRLTGGGANSAVWRQIMADAWQTEVVATTQTESAALGAAIQAAWTGYRKTSPDMDIAAITDAWVQMDEATRCAPAPHHHALYKDMQHLHDNLSLALRPLFSEHQRLFSK